MSATSTSNPPVLLSDRPSPTAPFENEDAALEIAALVGASKIVDDSPAIGSVVTEWDSSELRRLCLKSSPGFTPSLNVLSLVKNLFPPNEWWASKKLLADALRDYAKIAGFRVATNHNHIRCSRHGERTTCLLYTSPSPRD